MPIDALPKGTSLAAHSLIRSRPGSDRCRKWGKPKTRAIGTLTGNMGFSQRMRVILSKRERCGEQWRYGRVQIGKPGSKPTIDLQTFTC